MGIRARFGGHGLALTFAAFWGLVLVGCAVLTIPQLNLAEPSPPTGPQTSEEIAVAYVSALGEGDRRAVCSLQTYAESGGAVEECVARPAAALPDYAGGARIVGQTDLDQIGFGVLVEYRTAASPEPRFYAVRLIREDEDAPLRVEQHGPVDDEDLRAADPIQAALPMTEEQQRLTRVSRWMNVLMLGTIVGGFIAFAFVLISDSIHSYRRRRRRKAAGRPAVALTLNQVPARPAEASEAPDTR